MSINRLPKVRHGVSNNAVMPVKTGIQKSILDFHFRGNDDVEASFGEMSP